MACCQTCRERATADYWDALTRIRTAEAPSALRRIRAEGKTRDAAIDRLQQKLQDVIDEVTASLTGAPAGGSCSTTSLSDHLEASGAATTRGDG